MSKKRKSPIDLICLYDSATDKLYGLKTTRIKEAHIEAIARTERERIPVERCKLSVWRRGSSEDVLVEIQDDIYNNLAVAIDKLGEGLSLQ